MFVSAGKWMRISEYDGFGMTRERESVMCICFNFWLFSLCIHTHTQEDGKSANKNRKWGQHFFSALDILCMWICVSRSFPSSMWVIRLLNFIIPLLLLLLCYCRHHLVLVKKNEKQQILLQGRKQQIKWLQCRLQQHQRSCYENNREKRYNKLINERLSYRLFISIIEQIYG